MPIQILMPALSPTMEAGRLAKWLVGEGDRIAAGQVIAEIETERVTMEVEAVDAGVLHRILVPAGRDGVKVDAPICIMLLDGETLTHAAPADATRERAAGAGRRLVASPLARRLARECGIDLWALKGSGPRGRIVSRDVEAAIASAAAQAKAAAMDALSGARTVAALVRPAALQIEEIATLDVIRRRDVQRRILAHTSVPTAHLTIDCRVDAVEQARQRMNAAAPAEGPRAYRLTLADFLVKALALALQQVGEANATWTEDGPVRHRASDIAVCVATSAGIVAPVLRNVELKTLGEISGEVQALSQRARAGRLSLFEAEGAASSLADLGAHGIASFTAPIEPPHATALAVGLAELRPVVVRDRLEVARMMTCTLTCDLRSVDTAIGARLLEAFKTLVEDPVRMLV